MNRQRFRVFVSSPGDVAAAREVAAQVIEKVAHEYARFFIIEPYLWEYEPMLASGHFQDSIDPPSRFDVVLLILESRLGTPLPERTAVRVYQGMDGRAPVTGTEWEFEEALSGARAHGVPDLLVYRSRRGAEIDTWDLRSRQAVLRQIEALDAFWSRHFAHEGKFVGAYAKFKTLEELAAKLEQDLRACVQRRLEKLTPEQRPTGVRLWPTAPFRGLEAYEFEHAPIFFGREEPIGSALLRLVTQAEAGRPFLLILGASGSGKSSLVKAGVLPRLLVPQRVSGAAFLRRVAFHPGDAHADEDLFLALARLLTLHRGQDVGIPELLGKSMTVEDLARHLRENSSHPDLPLAMVLDQLAETARQRGQMLQYEQPRLILEVDQLEELFTSERVQPEERRRFVQLLAGLARSGLVWVIATMRSDFWHRAVETPGLVQLADREGRLDLLPPNHSELSQMIRGPAEAAAIHFEAHAVTGIPLNDLIAQEAAGEPGALPLLSYLLDQLYQRDIHEAGGNTLTYASYHALGGLKGAIATRADAVVASQLPEVRQALRPVLFALVQMSTTEGGAERAVARRAPLADFPQGTAKRRLIAALLDPSARLLVADAVGDRGSTVRLAHEALISEWATARNYVASNAEALKTRRMLEERYARWQAISVEYGIARGDQPARLGTLVNVLRRRFSAEQGLLTDVDLLDARKLLQNHREELSLHLIAYIERSIAQHHRGRQRAFRIALTASAAFGLLAVAASYEANVASVQREAALLAQQRSLTQIAAARSRADDLPGAMGVILDVLAHQGAHGSYTPEAINLFQETRAADAQVLILTGHTGWVEFGAYSSDGRRIATASVDKTARVWDATTGQQLLVLRGHTGRVISVVFSPDGQRAVTASDDGTVRVWNVVSGRQLYVLTGHKAAVSGAAFSPDGQRIVTASADKTARVWDATSGQQLLVLHGHTDTVASAAFSPDGRRIVTASYDRTARIWDATSGQLQLVLTGQTESLRTAAFSPDGRRIVTASYDKTARVWDATSGRQLLVLSGHTDFVESAAFSPDGRRIVTASFDKTARIWDATNGQQLLVLSGHNAGVMRAEFSPDGRHIVTASVDGTARTWDVTNSAQMLVLNGHTEIVESATLSPDGRRILTASDDRTARLWDAKSGRQLLVLSGHTQAIMGAAFSPDGRRIVTASLDATARTWDATSGAQLLVLHGHTGPLANATFSADGQRIATASRDRTVRVWDATTGKQLLVLRGHRDLVLGVDFSPDGRRIVTASNDRTARVWDATRGTQLLVLSGHIGGVESAAFSPDGRRIVTASFDSTARVWDAISGAQLLVLSGHTGGVTATFSPNGRRIVTASDDKTARVWDAISGEQLLVLSGHTDVVETAVFSPGGGRIVTASDDKSARVWDVSHVADLDAQLKWAAAAQFDPLSGTERFQLGLAPSSDVRRWSAHASQCDRSAAAPYDPLRRAQGVMLSAIVAAIAVPVCTIGGANSPTAPRAIYERGRALVAMGSFASAREDLERALTDGYSAAGVDLGMLLSQPSAGMLNVSRAISLYEQAWKDGVTIAAFELGTLYEYGVRGRGVQGRYLLAPDEATAWTWYRKGAASGEPNSLARFGEREDRVAAGAQGPSQQNADLLRAFEYYASASERARLEDWPDDAWRNWRYRRASLARILARQGMMTDVAREYGRIRQRYAPRPSLWQRLWPFGRSNE